MLSCLVACREGSIYWLLGFFLVAGSALAYLMSDPGAALKVGGSDVSQSTRVQLSCAVAVCFPA